MNNLRTTLAAVIAVAALGFTGFAGVAPDADARAKVPVPKFTAIGSMSDTGEGSQTCDFWANQVQGYLDEAYAALRKGDKKAFAAAYEKAREQIRYAEAAGCTISLTQT